MFYFLILILQVLILPTLSLNQDQYSQLQALSAAPQFSMEGKTFLSKVESIYDGDSLKLIIFLCDQFQRFTSRLAGIDTPEIRSGDVREFGYEVRDIVRGMINGKIVKVEGGQFDKYGRMLATVWGMTVDGEEIKINDYLVEHLMAKKYDGGKKQGWTKTDEDNFNAQYGTAEWPEFKDYPFTTF